MLRMLGKKDKLESRHYYPKPTEGTQETQKAKFHYTCFKWDFSKTHSLSN